MASIQKPFHTFTMKGDPLGKNVEIFLDGVTLMGVVNVSITSAADDLVRVEVTLIGALGESHVVPAQAGLTFKEIEWGATMDWKPPAGPPPSHLSQIADDLKGLG